MWADFLNEADSVLVVSAIDDYMQCNITDPIQQLPASGNSTMFQFTRLGYYYFISGDVDHCLAGQRMIVCVTLHPHPDSISLLLPLVPSSLSAAIGPSAYYDIEPTSSLSVRLYSGTRYHNVSSPVKVCAGYGSLSAIGAFLIVGFWWLLSSSLDDTMWFLRFFRNLIWVLGFFRSVWCNNSLIN